MTLRLPPATLAFALMISSLPHPASAETTPMPQTAAAQAIDLIAELRFEEALRVLEQAETRRGSDIAATLSDLLRSYGTSGLDELLAAEEHGRSVPVGHYDAVLAQIHGLLTRADLPDGTHLRDLWCHLWTLYPGERDLESLRRDAQFLGDDGFLQKRFAPNPHYTSEGRKDRVTGEVVLRLLVDGNGCVADSTVVTSLREDMDRSTWEAVRFWTFEPGVIDGAIQPTEHDTTVMYTIE